MPTLPRGRLLAALLFVLTTLTTVLVAGPAAATPPDIPTASTARSMLAGLTVATEGSMSGYSRDEFPH